jgi:hypothetical protein
LKKEKQKHKQLGIDTKEHSGSQWIEKNLKRNIRAKGFLAKLT